MRRDDALTALAVLGCWLAAAGVSLALSPRTPGRRLSYYALVCGASAPQLSVVGGAASLLTVRAGRRKGLDRRSLDGSAAVGGLAALAGLAMTIALIRVGRRTALNVTFRDVLRGPRPHVELVEKVQFVQRASGWLYADVYQARRAANRRPAVVVVHGGGWRQGDKSENPAFNWWLAHRGCLVFDLQYRLTPPAGVQEALEDIRDGVEWLRQHATTLRVDPERVVLMGRSAGGHLALLAAYCDPTIAARAVVALYAPTDLARLYAEADGRSAAELRPALESLLGGTPVDCPDAYWQASPLARVAPAVPPTLLIHGTWDRAVAYWPRPCCTPVHASN
jgi:acetyl esterase/lipase